MDYCEGGDLYKEAAKQVKDKAYFTEIKILDWLAQICLGLKYVKDNGLLYRDIKAQNCFLTKEKVVKLGDFGISMMMNDPDKQAKKYDGTEAYKSPELIQGRSFSYEADIWSLGVLLYLLTAFDLPFSPRNQEDQHKLILKGKYKDLPSYYSTDLKCLIYQMLQKKKKKRPTLEQILVHPILAKPIERLLEQGLIEYHQLPMILTNNDQLRNSSCISSLRTNCLCRPIFNFCQATIKTFREKNIFGKYSKFQEITEGNTERIQAQDSLRQQKGTMKTQERKVRKLMILTRLKKKIKIKQQSPNKVEVVKKTKEMKKDKENLNPNLK